MAATEFKIEECTMVFFYEDGQVTYKVELVGNQPPYRYAKWLFTQMNGDHPYFSYQCENDEELLILIGKNTLTSQAVNIIPKDPNLKYHK